MGGERSHREDANGGHDSDADIVSRVVESQYLRDSKAINESPQTEECFCSIKTRSVGFQYGLTKELAILKDVPTTLLSIHQLDKGPNLVTATYEITMESSQLEPPHGFEMPVTHVEDCDTLVEESTPKILKKRA